VRGLLHLPARHGADAVHKRGDRASECKRVVDRPIAARLDHLRVGDGKARMHTIRKG
jgi:hypothetical protein